MDYSVGAFPDSQVPDKRTKDNPPDEKDYIERIEKAGDKVEVFNNLLDKPS